MSKKYGTLTTELLSAIGEATGLFAWPPEGSYEWLRRERQERRSVYNRVHKLQREGLLKKVAKNGKVFLKLTAKGQLEYLMRNTALEKPDKWDGCWRLAAFDIPEAGHTKRDQLRWLLKRSGFIKMQASLFVSPYPLNRKGIKYLKESGLDGYIRFIRADEIDDDADLKRKFHLK